MPVFLIPFLPLLRKLGLVLVILAALFAAYRFTEHRGAMQERAIWQDRVAREDAANRKREAALQATVDEYATKYQADQTQRHDVETKIETRIIHDTATLPDCRVGTDIMKDRNALRAESGLPE